MNKLNRFRMVNKMCIHRDNVQQLYQSFPWHNLCLNTLQLTRFFISTIEDENVFLKNITNILQQIQLKHLVISKIYLFANTETDNKCCKLLFQQLFEANQNIECLSINQMYCRDFQLIISCMTALAQRLKALIIDDKYPFTPQILPILGQQLISLHLACGNNPQQITFTKDNKFLNLKEICLNENVNVYLLKYLINCAVKLWRFNWR
eukprot:84802_1